MPKIKTKRAAAKRYSISSSGRIKRFKAGKRHLATKKSRGRINRLKKSTSVLRCDFKLVARCMPNDL